MLTEMTQALHTATLRRVEERLLSAEAYLALPHNRTFTPPAINVDGAEA